MRFGVLYDFRNPPGAKWHRPWEEFYAETIDHMREVERLGFDAISLPEHHGDPDGYNPGLPVTLTAAVTATSRVRVGSNILQLPLYQPVMIAEQLAVLDIISGGRLDVGIGQVGATFDVEFGMFDRNPRHRPSLLDEGLDIMLEAWSAQEPFSYEGRRFTVRDVWLNPKPLQDPLPVWVVAAFSEKAMDRVARRGLDVGGAGGFLLGLTGGPMWTQWRAAWGAARERAERDPDGAQIHTFGTCFVTDDPERAWARHRDGCFHAFHYERSGIHPYSSLMMDTVPGAPEDMPGSELLFRTPESAIAEIREVWGDGHGPDEVHLVATKPGMSAEESLGFLRAFAEQVMPAVRDL